MSYFDKNSSPLNSSFPSRLEDQVGKTPLIQLRRLPASTNISPRVSIFAKAEWFNPSGSVKDRAALNIILTAERDGLLTSGMTILESTSGNTGIALSMMGRARGYKIKIVLPENASPERIAILRAYGVETMLTPGEDGVDGAMLRVRELAAANPGRYFYANQYDNPANWKAHYISTGDEIWEQTEGQITHFVTGLGTSGTFSGTTRRLKELNAGIHCFAIQPDKPKNGIEGLKHMATAIPPKIYDASLPDKIIVIPTAEVHEMARRLAREEGIFAGISGAANILGVLQVAKELDEGMLVTVLPDNGFKYVSHELWGK